MTTFGKRFWMISTTTLKLKTMTKQDLRIVFMGNPDFAVESLRRIHEGGYNIVGIVTMPDKVGGRGHHVIESPVKQYAVANGIPNIMQPPSLKAPEFVDSLRALNADLFIVIAFRMLPQVVWSMPPMGTFNLHASLLPKYRGAAPLNWAVINGDTETGVTTFFLKHEIDTGDIIRQEKIAIATTDNVGDVHDRLMLLGADLTIDTIDHIIAGDLKTISQDEILKGEIPTPAPKIFKETCHIDWNQPATNIHNLVRGLSPYPGAWTQLADGDSSPIDIKIFETSVVEKASTTPGKVSFDNSTITVDCGKDALVITSLQPAGKRRMLTADYLRGAKLTAPRFI
jgi:methionyl-tRNA formyltransferase